MSTRASEFFKTHVLPALKDWRNDQTNERLGMSLAVALNQTADYYFHSFPAGDPKLLNAKHVGQLRTELTKQNASYALIRDVAEAHKHVKLDRPDRFVTSAGQTTVGGTGWGEGGYGEGPFGGGPQLVVTLDDGTRRAFSAIVDETVKLWELLLQ